jgi:hypothetical protein
VKPQVCFGRACGFFAPVLAGCAATARSRATALAGMTVSVRFLSTCGIVRPAEGLFACIVSIDDCLASLGDEDA